MKKKDLLALMALGLMLVPATVKAQDSNIFTHASAGLSVGTDGIGIHVAAPIGNYVQTRMGYSFMPKIKYSTNVDVVNKDTKDYKGSEKIEGKLNMGDFNLLFDVFPFGNKSSFHVTAGAYIGKSNIIEVYNKEPIKNAEPGDGGDHSLPDPSQGEDPGTCFPGTSPYHDAAG